MIVNGMEEVRDTIWARRILRSLKVTNVLWDFENKSQEVLLPLRSADAKE
jgi:hypothetical protein